MMALMVGLLFGAGLAISQMVNPAKVLAFLDLGGIAAGTWDPSLALVMAGALAVAAPAYWLAPRRAAPLLGGRMQIPARRDLDRRLFAGALLFGAGWGLVGFCPGPAVAALGFGASKAGLFVAAMLAGMALYEFAARPREPLPEAERAA
jgi:uncharacterized membrane protein YedE/YeeE